MTAVRSIGEPHADPDVLIVWFGDAEVSEDALPAGRSLGAIGHAEVAVRHRAVLIADGSLGRISAIGETFSIAAPRSVTGVPKWSNELAVAHVAVVVAAALIRVESLAAFADVGAVQGAGAGIGAEDGREQASPGEPPKPPS